MRQDHKMHQIGQLALISLGSNETSSWGDPTETVQKAKKAIMEAGAHAVSASRLYATSAFPAGSGPDFVNAAIAFHTHLPAPDLLDQLHRIEAEAGRERHVRWGQRTLDLDLIAYGSRISPDLAIQTKWRNLSLADQMKATPKELILPHPRMQDRAFVLVPLADVAPDWEHPVLHLTVAAMCAALPKAARADVKLLKPAHIP